MQEITIQCRFRLAQSGVSKSQVGELVVAADQGNKKSIDSKLSRGRGSKFSIKVAI